MVKKLSFDPKKWAEEEIRALSDAVNECDGDKAITMASMASGNIEAAFYEKQINEEEMEKMKRDVEVRLHFFRDNCKCIAKSIEVAVPFSKEGRELRKGFERMWDK